ncbi:MAG: response regulator [bacterium]|nr:response regulator [bacterium]
MSRTKILAIDDEPDLLELLELVLERNDLLVLTAADGNEGLALAQAENPDLILLDLMMKGMDGWETLRRLKLDEQCQSIPVVILSVRSEPKEKIRALQEGAIDYLTKPFLVPDSLDRIRAILATDRLRELGGGGGTSGGE